MIYLRKWGALFALLLCPVGALAQSDLPVIRAATLQIGTVNWELETITREGFDVDHGFRLELQPYADNGATRVAVAGGAADMFVADWIWVARQRADGQDYVFIPYSTAVGGLVVPADSPVQSLADLAGGKIGIAGGPVDKSWLILQAYAQKNHDMDLAAETEQVFGAPPLIAKAATGGDLDGAINFWHWGAKMQAAGMRTLLSVEDAAIDLGLDPQTPLLGYVVKGDMLRDNPDLVAGMASASRAAKEILATDDAEWDRLRDRMNAGDDVQFAALIDGYRAGIPDDAPIDEDAAARMLTLMYDLGGAELLGDADTLPDGVFVQPGS